MMFRAEAMCATCWSAAKTNGIASNELLSFKSVGTMLWWSGDVYMITSIRPCPLGNHNDSIMLPMPTLLNDTNKLFHSISEVFWTQ